MTNVYTLIGLEKVKFIKLYYTKIRNGNTQLYFIILKLEMVNFIILKLEMVILNS